VLKCGWVSQNEHFVFNSTHDFGPFGRAKIALTLTILFIGSEFVVVKMASSQPKDSSGKRAIIGKKA
jgi:hypothetical protein